MQDQTSVAASAFTAKGAAVVLAGRRANALGVTAALIAVAGGVSFVVAIDVTNEAAIERLLASTRDRCGRLDAAFNNASILDMAPIAEATVDHLDARIAVNLRAVWLLIKHEAALMRVPKPDGSRGGTIVNTSSFVAPSATMGTSAYAASEGALGAMIRPLTADLGPASIRINNMAPGVIRTPVASWNGRRLP